MNRGFSHLTDVIIAIYKTGAILGSLRAILGLLRAIYFIKKGVGLISKR
jgi:hypothetical protein